MKKIIFISAAKTTNSMIERFYLDVMYNNGIDIEYWDIRSLYYEENKNYEFPFIKKISSLDELEKKLSSLEISDTIINLQFNYEFKYFKLFYLIRRFKTSFFAIGHFPNYETKKSKISVKIRKFFSKQLFIKLLNIFTKKIIFNKTDVLFYAGSKAKQSKVAKNYYPINYIDYEKINILNNDTKEFKYCVFLDINLHNHPDTRENGLEYINKDKYFQQLKQLFIYVEEVFSLKVLIALHPTSDYYNFLPKEYQFMSKTGELVKDCEFVISHYSTSTYLAVSTYKQILLINSKDMFCNMPYTKTIMDGLSRELNLLQISLDEEFDFKSLNEVDKSIYKEFLYTYCISEISKNNVAADYMKKYIKAIV